MDYTITPISVVVKPELDFLRDIAITFAENPYEWFDVEKYKWRAKDGTKLPFPEIKFVTADDSPLGIKVFDLTPQMLCEGIQKVLQNGSTASRGDIYQALMESDASGIDTDAADVILQYAVFGDIVYG